MKIKICGFTRRVDVVDAVRLGVDAVGFVFASSPRRVTAEEVADLEQAVPASVMKVGLFLDPAESEVQQVLARVRLDLLQFHGTVGNGFCRSFGMPFIRAVSVASGRAAELEDRYPDAAGLLFDTPGPAGSGGTGRSFDWSLLDRCSKPLWLAGGLNPVNVAEAIRTAMPDWVDVSSGVESAPGVKDARLMREFVAAARSAVD